MQDLINALIVGNRHEGKYRKLVELIIRIIKSKEKITKSELLEMLKEYGFFVKPNDRIFNNIIRKLKLIGLITLRRDKQNVKYYVYTPENFYEKMKIIYNMYLK